MMSWCPVLLLLPTAALAVQFKTLQYEVAGDVELVNDNVVIKDFR